jgi:hypothetical protein
MRTLSFAVPSTFLLAVSGAIALAQQPVPTQAPAGTTPAGSPADPTTSGTTNSGSGPTITVIPQAGSSTPDGKAPDANAPTGVKGAPDVVSSTDKSDSMASPGEDLDPHIKKGSEEDVDAVGTRNIGGRGMGNWYSTNWEIGTGKQYSVEIEKSSHLVTDRAEPGEELGCEGAVHNQGAGYGRDQRDGSAGRVFLCELGADPGVRQ